MFSENTFLEILLSSIVVNFTVSIIFLISKLEVGIPVSKAVGEFFFAWILGTLLGALAMYIGTEIGKRL
jgi:hypothetical protein